MNSRFLKAKTRPEISDAAANLRARASRSSRRRRLICRRVFHTKCRRFFGNGTEYRWAICTQSANQQLSRWQQPRPNRPAMRNARDWVLQGAKSARNTILCREDFTNCGPSARVRRFAHRQPRARRSAHRPNRVRRDLSNQFPRNVGEVVRVASDFDVQTNIERAHAVRQSADRNQIDAGLRDSGNGFQIHATRRFGQRDAIN